MTEGQPGQVTDGPSAGEVQPEVGVRPAFGRRIAGVEGLRAIAASGLVVWHTYLWASPDGPPDLGFFSTYGVPHLQLTLWIFFCLSAFLLYRPFAAAILDDRPRPSFGAYAENRVLRIVPAYWVILTLVTFVLGVAITRAGGGSDAYGPHIPTYLADLVLAQTYHPSGVLTGIAPAWSLAVEVVFYAVLPLLVMLAAFLARRARSHRGRLLACCAPAGALLAIGLISKRIGHRWLFDTSDPFGFGATWWAVWERSFLSQADLFAFGILIAVLRVEIEDGRVRVPRVGQAVALAGAVLLAVPLVVLNEHDDIAFANYQTLMAVVSGLLVLACVIRRFEDPPVGPLVRMLESRPFRWSGLLSYSIFLWHYPVVFWLREHDLTLRGDGSFAVNLLIVVAVTWVLSLVTYRYVEEPFLRRKRHWRVAPSPRSGEPAAPATVTQEA
jgi:peptidoglycan/LPS O-acetylase OafA/YrhL